mmetsp:Transcript_5584/g.11376  ORF Transcript_5584/g.11376 Transcript_5584/m.11376 type:complete len:287 (-) Transcript_5584:1444-2304(-)
MAEASTSRCVMGLLNLSLRVRRMSRRLRSAMDLPGRSVTTGRSFTMSFWMGGKPPAGWPMLPWKKSTTESGKERVAACARTASVSRSLDTMNCARSPTTLELGVTFTMSPHTSFAIAYAFFTFSHCSPRPREVAWNLRLVYWPPGISWEKTSEVPERREHSYGRYSPRTCSQYSFSCSTSSSLRRVSNLVPSVDTMTAPAEGWDVRPDMESTATSTTSAPASAHASMDATPTPAVSWVCTWMGRSGNFSRRAPTSMVAALGLRRPAISLMHSTWMSHSTSSVARFT